MTHTVWATVTVEVEVELHDDVDPIDFVRDNLVMSASFPNHDIDSYDVLAENITDIEIDDVIRD